MQRQGISPIIASILLAGLVAVAGTVLYTWWYLYTTRWTADLTSMVARETVSASQYLVILGAYRVDANTLNITVASGLYPVSIQSIYVNGEKALSFNPSTIEALKAQTIEVSVTSTLGSSVKIRIVYEGGVAIGNFSIAP